MSDFCKDLVTAVITTCNRPLNELKRALNSVLQQTYEHIEIIVIDDSQCDYIERTDIQNYMSKINNVLYVQHSESCGACKARNTGLSLAHGKYIAYLDDDDEWKSYKIEEQLKQFVTDDIALVYCGYEVLNENNNCLRTPSKKYLKGSIFDELIKTNFIGSTSFPLLRTDYLREIGGFDAFMQSAQDYDVWLRLSKLYKISYTKKNCGTYHIHSNEQISKNLERRVSGQRRIIEKNEHYLNKHKKIKALRILKLSTEYAEYNRRKEALKLWRTAVKLFPWQMFMNMKYLLKILKIRKHK